MNRSLTTILLAAAAILMGFYAYLQSSNLGDEVRRGRLVATELDKAKTDLKAALAKSTTVETAQKAAGEQLAKVQAELAKLQQGSASNDGALKAARDEAAKAKTALEAAQAAAKSMEADLDGLRDEVRQLLFGKADAEGAAKAATAKLAAEVKAREAAEKALAEARKPQ